MAPTRPRVRLHVEEGLAFGSAIELDAPRAHYLQNVMRLGRGDEVALFNGRDGEWRAVIDGIGRGRCSLSLRDQTTTQQVAPDLWLVFAPVKRAPVDFVAAKATELGVSALWPVITRYTVVSRINLRRVRANAVEAAEQCRRLTVPEVFEPIPLTDLASRWPAERRILMTDESGAGPPIGQALGQQPAGAWAVLVGPEGGFAPEELDALTQLPFVTPVGLGPRTLRSETAALAALACWQAWLGDWREPGAGSAAVEPLNSGNIGSG